MYQIKLENLFVIKASQEMYLEYRVWFVNVSRFLLALLILYLRVNVLQICWHLATLRQMIK